MEKEKRVKRIEIRVTEEEKQKIVSKANDTNLNVSQFILRCIEGKSIITVDQFMLFNKLKSIQIELNNTGKNINQYVKLMHMFKKSDQLKSDFVTGIEELLKEHYKIQEQCLVDIRNIKRFFK